ncbi:hypothetical protein G3R49_01655 [Shewanella sp. WXL01]|uniref:Pyrrolidone-carboxylate peptidase n=1 Tax=Shewanella maritima TaxID=2520507 RepID=A0A411PGA9_9GAMM|nr:MULTISPECIES: hypothetical protein [Shewanella]NKF49284.1 hypothetical protein [Shewanella sp. WXL01]QBF82585.1 hypothetical protein EXU30_07655 [Shewanella maritima]
MTKRNSLGLTISSLLMIMTTSAQASLALDVEEQRVPQATKLIPQVVERYQSNNQSLEGLLSRSTDELKVTQDIAVQGQLLWQKAVKDVQSGLDDDRPLYWTRLQMRSALKQNSAGFNIVPWQRQILVNAVEKASRGFSDINFKEDTQIKILLTGFDPFFLDRDIGQSNPSGLTALALDGYTFNVNGKQAQVETVMIPVRFADFDDGIIESLLTPFFRNRNIDMVVTVSMGRDDFDLERFPGRNRSAAAPDNLNVLTGASKQTPMPPLFNGGTLNGPEFIEFSLPVAAMQAVKGNWAVNDNHQVTTTSGGQFDAKSIHSLQNATSVEGSGGGYLSNEISYRSLLLRSQFDFDIPVGHIHTPRVKGHDSQVEGDIVEQVRAMVGAAASTL